MLLMGNNSVETNIQNLNKPMGKNRAEVDKKNIVSYKHFLTN